MGYGMCSGCPRESGRSFSVQSSPVLFLFGALGHTFGAEGWCRSLPRESSSSVCFAGVIEDPVPVSFLVWDICWQSFKERCCLSSTNSVKCQPAVLSFPRSVIDLLQPAHCGISDSQNHISVINACPYLGEQQTYGTFLSR